MATGIISSALEDSVKPVVMQGLTTPNATDPNAQATTPTPTPATTGYNAVDVATPTPWTVTDDQTTAGNIKSIIDENSPIIQQARTNAKMAANDRGMLNSSMAVSAGEAAVHQAALPIAQADAATKAKAAGYSVDQINQANQQNANFKNTAGQFNAKAINDATLQQINNDNQRLIQSNSSAASLMNQATGVINNIMMNDKMDSTSKTEASRQVYENLKTQLAIIGKTSSLDLSSLLNENPYSPEMIANEQAKKDAALAAKSAADKAAEDAAAAIRARNNLGIFVD